MDTQRVRAEVRQAMTEFALVEAHPTTDGSVYVKAVLQTSMVKTYFIAIYFTDYPYRMPKVFVTKPTLQPNPHFYKEGNICYLHPNMWNPGIHTLTDVLKRTVKWLNKYEVWLAYQRWPGAEVPH